MSGGNRIWSGEVSGVRFRIEGKLDQDDVTISRWCSETEDFVEHRECRTIDLGLMLERMTKFPPTGVPEAPASGIPMRRAQSGSQAFAPPSHWAGGRARDDSPPHGENRHNIKG